MTSSNTIFTYGAKAPSLQEVITEKLSQQTTLHWLSPSDPALKRLKPVRVREYTNIIRNSRKCKNLCKLHNLIQLMSL